ncbi:MAG TPA: hypothetical protein IAC04_02150 [Candidatus Coprenecus stercoravium]|uniref:Clostripain n=1 Tax=Candidatus Coprenecus stercoravium TaxID=2840735 RepID=A0A9D2GQ81_9BACT|nr:hypothetical protein [Candidatus Coprenecus stercoravium]
MRKIVIFPVVFILGQLLLSCSAGYGDAEPGQQMNADRTVLIYMAADNSLASNARRNLDEMRRGDIPYYFSEGSGNVLLVYADISGEKPRLMRLSKDRFGTVNTETLVEYEDHNSCSDSVMRSVLSYAAALFPAQENGLVLWSHGTGWLPAGYYSNPVDGNGNALQALSVDKDPYAGYVKSFGADGTFEMDIKTLAETLPVHYSYILFDACLMGGVEVAYELKDHCDYIVASAAEILAGGFPYEKIIPMLFEGRNGLESACWEFYQRYAEDGATVALIETSKLNALAESCLDIFLSGGRVAIRSLDMDSLQGYFRMDRHWFYDLGDLMSRISPADTAEGQTRNLYDVFEKALGDAVICKWSTDEFVLGGYPQFSIKKFSGLSTYVPNPENPVLDEYYKTLAWNKAVMMVE